MRQKCLRIKENARVDLQHFCLGSEPCEVFQEYLCTPVAMANMTGKRM